MYDKSVSRFQVALMLNQVEPYPVLFLVIVQAY
jgi:hypothetical protein